MSHSQGVKGSSRQSLMPNAAYGIPLNVQGNLERLKSGLYSIQQENDNSLTSG